MGNETSTQPAYSSKRIAKNTLILYIRMLFSMFLSFYTSRLVLEGLGIDDYGIYNVVGGVVAMFSFINGALATSTQRYLTYEIGQNNIENVKNVFTTSINIHIIIAVLVVVLSETLGLWFLYNKMTISAERLHAAFVVLQCSILSSAIMIITVPYNAIIVAYEKMRAFAYISILESVLRLCVAIILLIICDTDKLVLYSLMILCIQIIVRLIYGVYCKRTFRAITNYRFSINLKLFREMMVFSSWNFVGSMASIFMTQGLNILLNVFWGPAVNAARGIAVQVQSAVIQLASNFQTALNPQLIKCYAQNEIKLMHGLISRASRYSFCLLFCICLPIFFEAEFLLDVWLVEVPEHATVFLKLILCSAIFQSIANPLMTSAQATGHVKKYQLIVGGILTLTLPLAYIALKYGASPESVFIVEFVICIIAYIVRAVIVCPLIDLNMKEFFKDVVPKYLLIVLFSSIIPFILKSVLDVTVGHSIFICLVCVVSAVVSSYFIGFTSSERVLIINLIKSKIRTLK